MSIPRFGFRSRIAAIVAVAASCLASAAAAARQNEVWTLTAADFSSRRVSIVAMDDAAVRVRDVVSGEQSTLSWDRLLDFARDASANRAAAAAASGAPRGSGSGSAGASGGALVLLLANGDRLAGEPKSQSGETLTWTTAIGDVDVPLVDARAIVRGEAEGHGNGADDDVAPTEDVVILQNGDRAGGVVSAVNRESVQLSSAGGGEAADLRWDSVAAVRFAGAGGPQPAGGGEDAGVPVRAFRVTLAGDSRLTVRSVALDGDQLKVFTASGDAPPRPVPLKSVLSIEQLNGPVVWLTSLPPTERVYRPYFAQAALPARFGRAVDGGEIRVPSVAVPASNAATAASAATAPAAAAVTPAASPERPARAGIGVASYSRLEWAIPPGFARFRTQFAVAGGLPYANVTVRVRLDDARVAFEQADVTAATPPLLIDLPLGDAKTIALEVDYGRSLDVQDRANWIEPALLKSSSVK